MNLKTVFFLLYGSVFTAYQLFTQEFYNENYFRYADYSYVKNIKTVQLYPENEPMGLPILFFNTNQILELHFDDLSNQYKNYYISFKHCSANWEPSDLLENEFLESFNEDQIFKYDFSFNTDIPYIHYVYSFPNTNINFLKSGNYILYVYEEGKKEQPVLTKRFYIVDNKVTINATIKQATEVTEKFYKQEVDFTINKGDLNIVDPYRDLKIIISQNFRYDNSISGLKPKFINDEIIDFNYDYENNFDGNNEFRQFDIKSLKYNSTHVDKIMNDKDGIPHVFLTPDDTRSFMKYIYNKDLNGKFLIKRNEGNKSNTEADYVYVHFKLNYSPPITSGNLYVFGGLTDWEFKDEFKLTYDTLNQQYQCTALLKQGFYDYMYAFVPDKSKNKAEMLYIEGNHSETENDYYIFVYFRNKSSNYDELIGFLIKNSFNNSSK
ncbi:MAG: DUF5103 domain-containing protein [Vicingaceae bacterium]